MDRDAGIARSVSGRNETATRWAYSAKDTGKPQDATASGKPRNEERTDDPLPGDGGKMRAVALHEQAVAQHPEDFGLHRDATDQVEPRILLKGAQQDSQGGPNGAGI